MDKQNVCHVKRASSSPKHPWNRISKRPDSPPKSAPVHRRVRKACDRCRMKKTKCDGRIPCERCKEASLVCSTTSKKRTDFKQYPPGYVEVLERTQCTLIDTVLKLYGMVKNNEPWVLGSPEINSRGQPVIHSIASKLGCTRSPFEIDYALPEYAEKLEALQDQLQVTDLDLKLNDVRGIETPEDSCSLPSSLSYANQTNSNGSSHSRASMDYIGMLWSQEQQQQLAATKGNPSPPYATLSKATSLEMGRQASSSNESSYLECESSDISLSMGSPAQDGSWNQSPVFRNRSPCSPWSAGDDFLGKPQALGLLSHCIAQQQGEGSSTSSPLCGSINGRASRPDVMEMITLADGLVFADGTIRPDMLDCYTTSSLLN